ncbi:hypothetical protein DAEQUDRAFT_347550 [Daedalea quercina L-15889]|uniref:Uncharacterized protein n=1 Tax=Daedalea quercina L-15889 TaxID=1314783 RepID=A0A165PCZ6_9APHY|nr:hypothetical protein DAEQUDRAFT_347550 [Daedalea quercina L-15889]
METSQMLRKRCPSGGMRLHEQYSRPVLHAPKVRAAAAFDVNLFSVLRPTQAVISHMSTKYSGTILTVSSVASETPSPWSGIHGSACARSARRSRRSTSTLCTPRHQGEHRRERAQPVRPARGYLLHAVARLDDQTRLLLPGHSRRR